MQARPIHTLAMGVLAIALIAGLTGCSTPGQPPPSTPVPGAVADRVTDAETCEALTIPLTLVRDAVSQYQAGEIQQADFSGTLVAAQIGLMAVDTEVESAVASAVEAMQDFAMQPGIDGVPFNADAPEYGQLFGAIEDACAEAGAELAVDQD